jgi:hypothetical protein
VGKLNDTVVIMHTTLEERCKAELEHFVAKVHASKFDAYGQVGIDTPWMHYRAFSKAGLVYQIGTALAARAWFSRHGPAWAPQLPLGFEIPPLLRGGGPLHLLGRYAQSLEITGYNYREHPQLYPFACGVMAHPAAPACVRDDPELKAEFPPKPLPGLSGRMIWYDDTLQPGERVGKPWTGA